MAVPLPLPIALLCVVLAAPAYGGWLSPAPADDPASAVRPVTPLRLMITPALGVRG